MSESIKPVNTFVASPGSGERVHRRVSTGGNVTPPSDPEQTEVTEQPVDSLTSPDLEVEAANDNSAELQEKKKHWLVRTGHAASMHFQVLSQVGVKRYTADIAERAIDSAKEAAASKAEAILTDITTEINRVGGSISEQYHQAINSLAPSLDYIMQSWLYKRELAKQEKAKREALVKERVARIKSTSESRSFRKQATNVAMPRTSAIMDIWNR